MIAILRHNYKIEILFPIAVLILSVISLVNKVDMYASSYPNYFSILTSLTGVVAVVLYLRKAKYYTTFFLIWTLAQLFIVVRFVPDYSLNKYVENPIWKTTQVYQFSYFMVWNLKDQNKLKIGLNFVPMFYLGFVRLIYISSLYGRKISIRPFKADSFLSSYLPATATIQKRVNLSGEKEWLLVELEQQQLDSKKEFALIKPKDDGTLSPKSKNRIIFYLIVPDPALLKEDINNRADYKTGDWAVVN